MVPHPPIQLFGGTNDHFGKNGFNDIKIPGEIERNNKVNSDNKIYLPKKTWEQLITIVSKQNKKL